MKPDPYTETVEALLALGGQRVWSLMVTLFGDLAQNEGTAIDGPVLSAVMAAMDIRPEAVRVALHRLRNDGWIISEKRGRTRRHALTPKSRKESAEASARIYAPPGTAEEDWQIALLEDATVAAPEEMAKRGFAPLGPRIYVGGAKAEPPKHALMLEGSDPPGWLGAQLADAMLTDEYAALLPILRTADRRLGAATLTPLQLTVLRCLIVHNWRRIILRHPPLPAALLPDGWAGTLCHAHVHSLLAQLPRPDLSTIRPA